MAKMGGGMANSPGAAQPTSSGFMSGLFGDKQSPQRYDEALSMLQTAMQGAGGANSPVLSFLTPLLGAMIGPKIEAKRDAAKSQQAAQLTETLLGPGGMSPQARNALEVMNNPNAPSYLQQIAATMFKSGISTPDPSGRPSSGRTATSGGAGSGTSAKGERLFGEYNLGGVLAGRDRYGNITPYKGPDGQPIPFGKGPTPIDPKLDATPAMPQDPQTAPQLDTTDPLGLFK